MSSESKLSLTLYRETLIPTGSFSNVKSAVTISLSDVDPEEFSSKQHILSEIIDNIQSLEIHSMLTDKKMIKEVGYESYQQLLDENIEKIQTEVQTLSKKL